MQLNIYISGVRSMNAVNAALPNISKRQYFQNVIFESRVALLSFQLKMILIYRF